jgi:hypothetical protein
MDKKFIINMDNIAILLFINHFLFLYNILKEIFYVKEGLATEALRSTGLEAVQVGDKWYVASVFTKS